MAIIGIDLGTTNSLASVWKDGKCILIPNRFSEYLTPSVVSMDEDGNFYTGKIAKERLISHPRDTAALFKRTMGTKKTYTLAHKPYSSEELSSFIIRQLVEDAQEFLKEPIEEAIISVPAYFNDHQRSATKNAGALANIKVERLINEPSAAALYARNGQEDATFLVFDFGGGTLDISIVECFENVISILAVSGNNHLGGSDFDEIIARSFCEENGLSFDMLAQGDKAILLRQAEECKMTLTVQEEVTHTFTLQDTKYSYTIDNQKLIFLSASIFECILEPIQKAMRDADVTMEDLKHIILVGGSSKMPIVRSFLEQETMLTIEEDITPDTIVANGIGVYTGIKSRKEDIKDVVLSDICPFTLGIAVNNPNDPKHSLMHTIIERNTILPSSMEHSFFTVRDFQSEVSIRIYQGESMYCHKNLLLAEKKVKVKKAKKGEFPIQVRFTYDINGILDVDIKDSAQGHVEKLLITNEAAALTKEQIEERLQELQKLKVHPREQERNKLLLAKIERLFEETIGEERDFIQSLGIRFEKVLTTQQLLKIDKERLRIEEDIKSIEERLHPQSRLWS